MLRHRLVLDDPDGDEAREWVELGVPETAAGIDYLVGRRIFAGRASGPR